MSVTGSQGGSIITHRGIKFSMRWTMVLLCCYIFSHCALQPIPHDLATYINGNIYGIVELENLALKRYEQHTGSNFSTDTALRASLDTEIIPLYRRFTDLVGRIKPHTSPVQKLHANYRSAAALRLQGFRTILLAIDTQDPDLLRQANRFLEQGQHSVKVWRENVAGMAKQYGLELK
jgi:hypothetical protein